MKKFIAIALIAIVAVTAAFATETEKGNGQIKVTYKVTDDEPVFAIGTGSISIDAAAIGAVATSAHEVSAALADDASATEVVEFTLSQNNAGTKAAARSHFTYYLTVEATDLILVVNNAQKGSPDDDEKFDLAGITALTLQDDRTNVTQSIVAENAKVKLVYKGLVEDGDIATFKATWNANTSAKDGDYLAYVTMTVTAE